MTKTLDDLKEARLVLRQRMVTKIKRGFALVKIFDHAEKYGLINERESSMAQLLHIQKDLSDLKKIFDYNNSITHCIRLYKLITTPSSTIVISDSESDIE